MKDVHGVFGGWTASDIVAPVQDIADLAYDIYGPAEVCASATPTELYSSGHPAKAHVFVK